MIFIREGTYNFVVDLQWCRNICILHVIAYLSKDINGISFVKCKNPCCFGVFPQCNIRVNSSRTILYNEFGWDALSVRR